MLVHTKPDTKGKEAVLFRSRQLTEFRWTPAGDIPVYTKATGKTKLSAGVEQLGMLYSSTEPTDKFITENISFETFLTIVANPDSALYHKDLNGHNNSWAYFGIVCNGLARYAFNIQRRYSTKRWPTIPGMRKIADEGNYSPEQIALCDVLYAFGKGRNHVALITDILRDADGTIRQIEVSEAVRPTCERKQYDLDTFFEKYQLFALWRYDFVDEVPMPDPIQDAHLRQGVPGLPVIAVDYGNKTNYRTYEDVVISTFTENDSEVEICRGGEVIECVKVPGRSRIVRRFDRGYYTIIHKTTRSTVEFCVTDPQIRHSVEKGMLIIKADPCDPESRISHLEFRERSKGETQRSSGGCEGFEADVRYDPRCASLSKMEELTDEEKKTGEFARKIPSDAVNFKVSFENRYGFWTHTMIKIE